MAKYKCTICGEIYDEEKENIKFEDLPETWVCPKCGVPKIFFEKVEEVKQENSNNEEMEQAVTNYETNLNIENANDDTPSNAIKISKDNVAIERDIEKCINCGICATICKEREGIEDICDGKACINCGQCIQFCPTGALAPKKDKDRLEDAMDAGKICIAYTSPSVRVAIGDEFGMEKGTFAQGKLVSALRKLGFKYVLDVTFSADLTIMEEANELVDRIKNNGKLPMFTSCCPSWIKYAEQYYPELLDNISTCKSPIGMQGEIAHKYFANKYNLDENNIYTVAITPCTAKKYEVAREEIPGTDLVITVKELTDIIKEKEINFNNLADDNYDSLLGEGTGAGMIFGNTGGVMEAAFRTAYNILTCEELAKDAIEFKDVRGMDNVKEASVIINGIELNLAVIHKMSAAKFILEDVKNGTSKYHYIEIMNCQGGCIGGGGQPKTLANEENEVKQKRIDSLYKRDNEDIFRCSHNNPEIIRVYDELLGKPLSSKAEELLHTTYENKSSIEKY